MLNADVPSDHSQIKYDPYSNADIKDGQNFKGIQVIRYYKNDNKKNQKSKIGFQLLPVYESPADCQIRTKVQHQRQQDDADHNNGLFGFIRIGSIFTDESPCLLKKIFMFRF
jgi:hypothetical protein